MRRNLEISMRLNPHVRQLTFEKNTELAFNLLSARKESPNLALLDYNRGESEELFLIKVSKNGSLPLDSLQVRRVSRRKGILENRRIIHSWPTREQ